jgi:hypothetical protein
MLMRTVAAVGIAVALIACTAAPIYNVQSTPISTASGKKPTTAQGRPAWSRAASPCARTWR